MYIMLNKKAVETLLNRLDSIQKEIEAIHQQLLLELDSDELTAAERAEIEAIRNQNEYKTFNEWESAE